MSVLAQIIITVLRITNGFNRLSDAALIARAKAILQAMTGNVNFATPQPSLADVSTTINTFDASVAVADKGSALEKAEKNQKRALLIVTLHSLGNYVLAESNNDEIKALSSGYSIGKTPSPAPAVTPATGQELKDGANKGELAFSFKRVPGAKSYIYQCTPDPLTPASVWQTQVGTVRKTVFTGLQSSQRYWVRVMAIGTGGQGVYSEPVSRVVQ